MDFEAEITGLLDQLTSVQTELLDVLAKKRTALATANMAALMELQPREESLSSRLLDCQNRRTSLLAEAKKEGRPSESVARLANSTGQGKTNRLGNQVKESGRSDADSAAPKPGQLGASTAVAATCFAASGDYRYRGPNAADIWR